ncbi:MAG: HEPN domain-containing protein [Acidobacteria bacterium]|nr:HEPN domain-containing protein [Acidobacteriota bacterium]
MKDLARLRLREAEALFAAGCYNGAVYLCGYAVEVALKARICRLLGVESYPEGGRIKGAYAVHDLDQLLLLAGLREKIGLQEEPLFKNWGTTVPWNPDLRYRPPGTISRPEALVILDAIRHPKHGVLRWIKNYW